MNSKGYQQIIVLDHHIEGIFGLPCVEGCLKEPNGRPSYRVNAMNAKLAREGDLLCQDREGRWWVERKSQEGGAV